MALHPDHSFCIATSLYAPLMSRSDIHIPCPDICSATASVFKVKPCNFQVKVCDLQLQGKDVFLVAPTGSGKSLTFLMPFIWQQDGVSLLISPLQLLGGQHANHAALETLGVKSINLTSETASDTVFKVCFPLSRFIR